MKRKKLSENNKLISIRIPEKTISRLREISKDKDKGSYQRLIKSYIAKGLDKEFFSEELEIAAIPAGRAKAQVKEVDLFEELPPVMKEDIKNLAESLKPYWGDFSGRTFLVTGAFGFLGRYMVHLLYYLNQNCLAQPARALLLDNFVTGYEPGILTDGNLKFYHHDVATRFETDEKIDYIIHAAGIASPAYYTKYPIETMDVGTVGTRNMLELAHKKSVKGFIFMSSSEVYGDPDPAHVPTKETYHGNVSVSGPRACYDESKRFGETLCYAYWQVFHVPVKIIRPFNVYGPGIRPDDYRVLPNFIEHALRKEPLPVHNKGNNTRAFCYINDAIEAIFRVLFSEHQGEPFNVGNPEPEISVKELAEIIAESMPHPVDVVQIDPPHAVYANSDPKRRCPDISKLTVLTGFKPHYTLEQGLERTIRWFREQIT